MALESIIKPSRIPLSSARIQEDTPGQRNIFVYMIRNKITKANNHWIIENVKHHQSDLEYNSNNLQNSEQYLELQLSFIEPLYFVK